ncbi:phage holin family protein [Bradyrhizobium barranii subsp. barranii]|uniref:Phage holin family protein n=1 Tax=Bradyrhizobium barranii subsp. barranii TaxID=2823807 RepID=A0A939M450_9BRAD|nr:phage holin family protein [Bradyrhizobium barranii]UEM13316.1 phage holin family protein [Bradyrhizobium barranii subsp. barranii]
MSIEHNIETGKSDLSNISGLVGDALVQVTKLFQNEVDLAKAELGEKVQRLGKAFGLLAGGAVLVIPAIVMALFALASALINGGCSPTLAYLTSTIVAAAISGALFAMGIKRLDARSLAPRETIRQLEKDKDTVKGMMR